MTETSGDPSQKRASKAGAKTAVTKTSAVAKPVTPRPARSSRTGKKLAVVTPEPTHRHPNLGLAPMDMTAGFPSAAAILRRSRSKIAARALEVVVAADPDFRPRFDDAGLRQLLHDTEVLIDRLAMCVEADDSRPMAEFAEWIGPAVRRRRVSLWDIAALCEGVREVATPKFADEEAALIGRTVDAAVAVLRKNGRLGGDPHKRNALFKWLYRGV